MEKITMLGTGHAMVTHCYNTCFLIGTEQENFLVDAGGGNGILLQMERAGADWGNVKGLFVTHTHTDHITGVVWVVRRIAFYLKRTGALPFVIYGHRESIALIDTMCREMLSRIGQPFDFMGGRLQLRNLEDGEAFSECGMNFTAFDIGSEQKQQFGFRCEYRSGRSLVCLGDESFHESSRQYAQDCDWLMHESFSADSINDPRHHGSARRAAQNAKSLNAGHLILYHMEDRNLSERKEIYSSIAAEEFSGKIWVPDDLESITLC